MADLTLPLTHYWPWDGDEQRAVCGVSLRTLTTPHSLTPTCPDCQRVLAADAELVADTVRRLEQYFPIEASLVAYHRRGVFR
jgi:hypothetical protein